MRCRWLGLMYIRTTNPIESTFATVRLRTRVTKGAGSQRRGLMMAFILLDAAQARWREINSPELVALLQAGSSESIISTTRGGIRRRTNRASEPVGTPGQLRCDNSGRCAESPMEPVCDLRQGRDAQSHGHTAVSPHCGHDVLRREGAGMLFAAVATGAGASVQKNHQSGTADTQ